MAKISFDENASVTSFMRMLDFVVFEMFSVIKLVLMYVEHVSMHI